MTAVHNTVISVQNSQQLRKIHSIGIQYYKKMVGQTQRPWVRENPTSCLTQDPMSDRKKGFRQLCVIFTKNSMVHDLAWRMANNPYLMVRSRSEYYTSMLVSGLPTFLISLKNMNLLSSSIYKHLKTYLIKHKQSLILGECGSQLISVLSNIFQF
jgi:hypothetical protein